MVARALERASFAFALSFSLALSLSFGPHVVELSVAVHLVLLVPLFVLVLELIDLHGLHALVG